MKPFFPYHGSKYRLAKRYGPPQCDVVFDVCAGSACFPVYWDCDKVVLCERNPTVAGVWRWLIGADSDDVMEVPLVTDLAELPPWVPQGCRDFIGFTFVRGAIRPQSKPTPSNLRQFENKIKGWDKMMWGKYLRELIANQVSKIKNWEIVEGSYADLPNEKGHWFIDPPYQILGGSYIESDINYQHLAEFSRSRKGVVDVCESAGADYLPFMLLKSTISQRNKNYMEVVCRFRDGVLHNWEYVL